MNYRNKAIKRLVEGFQELDAQAQDEVIDHIQYNGAIRAAREAAKTKTVTFGDLYREATERAKYMNQFEGFGSGLHYFDMATMGFRPGEVTIIAGPPNFGKTMVALNVITNTVTNSLKKGLIISLEMTAPEIATRIFAIADDHTDILKNLVIQTDLRISAEGIAHIIEREKPDIVMIDMLQKLANRERYTTEYERVSSAMDKVKNIALSKQVPILLISHVAKTRSGKNGEATEADLKGASNIEQDADIGLMINKASKDSFDVVVKCFKHRIKRPAVYNKNCLLKTDGIKILDDGKYQYYS